MFFCANMSDAENEVVGCVSSIRKRLLCTCIRMGTSDSKRETNGMQVVQSKYPQKANISLVSLGIVPRLMGLESMPEPSLVPKYRPLDSFRPRRSADSIDYPRKYDLLERRQVGKSVSFRDLPTYLKDDEKEFFLVRAENNWQKKIHGSEAERAKNMRKGKQVWDETIRNENDCMRTLATGKPIGIATAPAAGEDIFSMASKGKRQDHMTAADRITLGQYLLTHDRAAEKSEPLRVIPKTHVSAKETSKERCSNLRRKKQLEFLDSKFLSRRRSIRNGTAVNKKRLRCNRSFSYCLKSKRDAFRLAKEDLGWLVSKPREEQTQVNVEEIGTEFEARILDGLVHEVVTELWGFYLNNMVGSSREK